MKFDEIKYPLRLCVELMHYCAWSNPKTCHSTPSDLYEKLGVFFTEEQIEESRKILRGEISTNK